MLDKRILVEVARNGVRTNSAKASSGGSEDDFIMQKPQPSKDGWGCKRFI